MEDFKFDRKQWCSLLRTFREKKGYTKQKFAQLLEVTDVVVGQFEKPDSTHTYPLPTMELFNKMCHFLELSESERLEMLELLALGTLEKEANKQINMMIQELHKLKSTLYLKYLSASDFEKMKKLLQDTA